MEEVPQAQVVMQFLWTDSQVGIYQTTYCTTKQYLTKYLVKTA